MSSIENLRQAILRQREEKPKSLKAPGSSPLNLYVAEILTLREDGFSFAEIASALYLQHQVKTDERVLSKFVIRYRNRMNRQSSISTSWAMPRASTMPKILTTKYRGSVDGDAITPTMAGSEHGDAVRSLIAGSPEASEFVSSSTRQQIERSERQLASKIFNFIETARPVVREDFRQKHGHYPENFQSDIEFWKMYWRSQSGHNPV